MQSIAILLLKKQGDLCGDVKLFYAWCFFTRMTEYSVTLFGQISCSDGENTTRPAKGVLAWGWREIALDVSPVSCHVCRLSVKFFCGVMASKLQSLCRNVSKVE